MSLVQRIMNRHPGNFHKNSSLGLLILCKRMEITVFFLQALGLYMSIDLRGSHICMTQHFLDRPDIGSTHQ